MKSLHQRRFKPVLLILLTIGLLGASVSMGDADPSTKARLAAHQALLKKDPSNFQNLKEAGILAAELSRDNPKTYASLAMDYFTRAHDLNKEDDETLCYLGSAVTMMARTTINPLKKSGYVNRGCGYMDKAVRRSPDNITVRMTRGYNSMSLPKFLNRRAFAFEDFEYLAERFESEPDWPVSLKKKVYHNLAELYRTKDTAKAEEFDHLASALPDNTP